LLSRYSRGPSTTFLHSASVLERHKSAITIPAALIGGVWALWIYYRSKEKERAEWLHELFTSFYLSKDLCQVRMSLEFGAAELIPLIERVMISPDVTFDENQRKLLCDLDTSLNYFEFILHLEERGQLRTADREAIFKYWYNLINEPTLASMRMYISRYDYEALAKLVKKTIKYRSKECIALYGSLRESDLSKGKPSLEQKLSPIGPCSIPGYLYDLGKYPGLVKGPGIVTGELYEIVDPTILNELDEYEGFNRTNPNESLFVRRGVQLTKPVVDCWIYYYSGEIRPERRIQNGDWIAYKNK